MCAGPVGWVKPTGGKPCQPWGSVGFTHLQRVKPSQPKLRRGKRVRNRFVKKAANRYLTPLPPPKELREVADELGPEASWMLMAEAAQYRETLALEQAMKSDVAVRRK